MPRCPGINQPAAAQALNAQALKKAVPPATTTAAAATRCRALAELAAIRRRGRPSRGAVEARADVCQRRRRHPGRPARLRIFQPHRQRARRGQPVGAAGAIVANAFVALGRYYLNGIPNSKIKADTDRAREMFSYAASYFGNADAQYDLARLYLKTPDARGMISATARAGSALPPRRASTRRRRCSARCCSTATGCRRSARAA